MPPLSERVKVESSVLPIRRCEESVTLLSVNTTLNELRAVRLRLVGYVHRSAGAPATATWPGVAAAVLLVLVRVVLPAVSPEQTLVASSAAWRALRRFSCGRLFFSRARWADRLGVLLLTVVGLGATWFAADASISTRRHGRMLSDTGAAAADGGSRGLGPGNHLSLSRRPPRHVAATILLACAAWTLVKTGGFDQALTTT